MRKTYRSKKETGGGLDPRDMVLAMDEKSSGFDAFYIQNIKQTKRDHQLPQRSTKLPVGASMFAASNKVRKRKYVKRLKDPEPIIRDTRESSYKSGYLTPDRSIHLKRALDPFDLLLNSPLINEVSSQTEVFSPLHTRGKGKTSRKKALHKKKINYSSDSTDSDKENLYNCSKSNETKNLSNVLSHKLEIEKEVKIISKDIDESINNIVTDLALLNKIQNLISVTPRAMKDKLSMSSIHKSPFCSTPYHKKYRGTKSIYKFSPISVDDSKYTITGNLEECIKNKSKLNIVPNATEQFPSPDKSSNSSEIDSPILSSRKITAKDKSKGMLKSDHPVTKETSLFQTSEQELFLGFPISNATSTQNIITHNLQAVTNKYLEVKDKTLEDLQQSQYLDFINTNSDNKESVVDTKNNYYSIQINDNDASSNVSTRLEYQTMMVKSLENLHSPKFEDNTDQFNEQEIKQGSVNKPHEEARCQTFLQESNIVDHEHSLNNENNLKPSQTIYSENSTILKNEYNSKEVNLSEANHTYTEEDSTGENEHSLNEQNDSASSETYSEKNSTVENKHTLNNEKIAVEDIEQNTLESSQSHSEKNSTVKSEDSSIEERNSEEGNSKEDSTGENEYSLYEENNLCSSKTYLEENSTVENSLVEESNSEEENEHNTWKLSQTHSEEHSTSRNEYNLIEEGTSNTIDTESFYESCNSEHEMSDIAEDNKEPLVVIERLNDTVFEKYYKKDLICDSSQSDDINDDSCSNDSSSDIYIDINENDTLLEGKKLISNDNDKSDIETNAMMNISNTDEDVDSNHENNKSDDDIFSSFVTRRRKNERTKAFMFSFENSPSTSSGDFDKTVLSNNKHSVDNLKENNDDSTLRNNAQEKTAGDLADNSQICDNKSLLHNDNTIIETELIPFPKVKRVSVAVKPRKKSKLSAEKPNRESVTEENVFTSRNSEASKMSSLSTRTSFKLSAENLNRESVTENHDLTLRNSEVSKKSSVSTRKSSKLSAKNLNRESVTGENDLTSINSEASKKISVSTRKKSTLSAENINRKSVTEENNLTSRNSEAPKESSVSIRKSFKLAAENLNRESVTEQNDLTSRNSESSKKSSVSTRKSSKLSPENLNREFVTEKNDRTSINSEASKMSSVSKISTRKTSKLSTEFVSRESNTERNDCISRNTFIPHTNMMTAKSSTMYEEGVDTKHTAQNLAPPKYDIKQFHKVNDMSEIKQGIVLEPGKRWERSLSIYRRVTTMGDHFDLSMLDDEQLNTKGRKYRQSVINTMEMQDYSVSLHNESVKSRRSALFSKPSRSTIKILRESNASRISLSSTLVSEDVGFLSEDCDDTLVELSKLAIIDDEHEVTVLDKFNDTSNRITTARDYVLRRCNQTDVIQFDECYPDTVLKNCRKIGEGVYGEVYLWRARDGRARVLKIVPIAGDTKVNGESQKDYHEIISEIVIAMELSALRAPIEDIEKHLDEGQGVETLDLHSVENATDVFNEVLAVRCVYGNYPSRLLDLWELYDESRGSENDSPAALPADQQFMVLELANAGQDLESYQFHNAEQAYALFKQVAFGLAVAEEAFQFEHRDLHWGNVLIAPTDQKYATFVLRGRTHRVARRGVAATIIDYSLSRLSLRLPSADSAALYNDLATDDGLFDAVGDYQFEVYRHMRDKLGNDWKNYEPYTNILWLHYTVDKMITALRYTRTNTKIHKHYIAKLKELKNRVLDYGSATQLVLTNNEL